MTICNDNEKMHFSRSHGHATELQLGMQCPFLPRSKAHWAFAVVVVVVVVVMVVVACMSSVAFHTNPDTEAGDREVDDVSGGCSLSSTPDSK